MQPQAIFDPITLQGHMVAIALSLSTVASFSNDSVLKCHDEHFASHIEVINIIILGENSWRIVITLSCVNIFSSFSFVSTFELYRVMVT